MTRSKLTTALLLFIINSSYGQYKLQSQGQVLAIDSIAKTTFKNGDTLSVTVRNLTPHDRGFTVEALSLDEESYYDDAVYSAYLNNDTLFFKKLRALQRRSGKNHLKYTLPDYKLIYYGIKANSNTTIKFIMKGTAMQKGTLLRLRITSDIVNDADETAYSNPIKIISLYFYNAKQISQ